MDNELNYNDLQILEKLGEGAYGVVHKAVYNDMIVAAKETLEEGCCENEIIFLRLFSHRYVTRLIGTCRAPNGNMITVTEYEDSFTLKRVFGSRFSKTHIGDMFKIAISYHISKGLEHMHNKGVYHGDVKPDNILLNTSFIAKVCDLGMCGYDRCIKSKNIGTECWSPQEKIDYGFSETNNYCGYASDTYSLGLVLLYMFTDFDPEVGDKDKITHYIKLVDPKIGDIISRCTFPIPSRRPSTTEVSDSLLDMIIALPILTGEHYLLRSPVEPEEHEMSNLNRSMYIALKYITLSESDSLLMSKAQNHWANKRYIDAINELQNLSDTSKWVCHLYAGTAYFENLLPTHKSNVIKAMTYWKKAMKYRAPCILNRLYLCYKFLDVKKKSSNKGDNSILKDLLTKSLTEPLYPNVELFLYWGVDGIESAIDKQGNNLKMYILHVLQESNDLRARLLYARLLQFNITLSNTETNIWDSIEEYNRLLTIHKDIVVKMRLMLCYQSVEDYEKSFFFCEYLAKEHVSYAQVELGRMYCQGSGCVQDDSNALQWMQTAASNGIIEAIAELGMYYYFGICNERDVNYAEMLFTKSAERGDLRSMIMLAKYYNSGRVWVKKIVLCKNRNPNMFNRLDENNEPGEEPEFSLKTIANELINDYLEENSEI